MVLCFSQAGDKLIYGYRFKQTSHPLSHLTAPLPPTPLHFSPAVQKQLLPSNSLTLVFTLSPLHGVWTTATASQTTHMHRKREALSGKANRMWHLLWLTEGNVWHVRSLRWDEFQRGFFFFFFFFKKHDLSCKEGALQFPKAVIKRPILVKLGNFNWASVYPIQSRAIRILSNS